MRCILNEVGTEYVGIIEQNFAAAGHLDARFVGFPWSSNAEIVSPSFTLVVRVYRVTRF
jgi:hypothetical protein